MASWTLRSAPAWRGAVTGTPLSGRAAEGTAKQTITPALRPGPPRLSPGWRAIGLTERVAARGLRRRAGGTILGPGREGTILRPEYTRGASGARHLCVAPRDRGQIACGTIGGCQGRLQRARAGRFRPVGSSFG